MPRLITDKLLGYLLVATTALVILSNWREETIFSWLAGILVVPVLLLLSFHVRWTRQIFVVVGLVLVGIAAFARSDWLQIVQTALGSAAFIAAFFTALATIRNSAASSRAIETCGHFLAQQPPGRRYAALTVGGQLFGMLLNYGALVLLGSLAEANARLEPNAEIRGHRIRRMLLAIQRGFVSTLTWSPLAFAVAISTSVIPGATWAEAVGPCLVSAAILALLGWGLDTIFKPRLSVPVPQRARVGGTWFSLWPLIALLGILVATIGGLHIATKVSIVGVVMLIVPILSAVWIAIQNVSDRPLAVALNRTASYISTDLPGYRSEIVLLMMAGFIGTLGARLLSPLMEASAIDITGIPGWQILIGIVWLIPLTGQLGMNPILSVSLLAPLLPEAAAMGVTPADIIVAVTAGWALSGASSPYTATTLIIGSIGKVSALHVGVRWNGTYTLLCGLVLSLWVAIVALT
jgi:hypothetical protein